MDLVYNLKTQKNLITEGNMRCLLTEELILYNHFTEQTRSGTFSVAVDICLPK